MKSALLNDAFFGRLETLALNLRTDLTGFFGGKHLVRTYGQTVEFADFREYMPGDDIRRIDWNLFSRFEKYFIKLFTDERQMQVQIFLDCSASMGKANPRKAEYAVATAAALGFLAVHNMDKVSFRLMQGDKATDPFGTLVGKTPFFRAVGELENISYDGDTDIAACVTGTDVGTRDGLSVIISDFFTDSDIRKAIDYLCYKRRQVLLVQVMTPEEVDPVYTGRMHLIDVESDNVADERNMKLRITRGMQLAYAEALHDHIDGLRTFCASRDAGFVTVTSDMPIEKMLFGELLKVGVLG